MAWVLVALLLLSAGVWTADTDYGMVQPAEIFAVRGGSVQIPFRFFHTWELASDPKINLLWRWKDFHGKFIYNMSSGFVHKHFKNRLVLNYTKNGNSGFLSISNLRQGDSTTYYCRVQLNTKDYGLQAWQSIPGTKLIITEAIKTTTQTKTTTERSTSVASEVTSASITVSESQPLSLGAFVGVAVATAMLITGVLGLLAFLRWRKKGRSTTTQAPAGEFPENMEEKYENPENIGYKRQHRGSQQSPKDESTVYAQLTLSNSSSPRMFSSPPLHGNTQEETTVYSVLKTK